MYWTGILTVKDKEANQNDAKRTCPDHANYAPTEPMTLLMEIVVS